MMIPSPRRKERSIARIAGVNFAACQLHNGLVLVDQILLRHIQIDRTESQI